MKIVSDSPAKKPGDFFARCNLTAHRWEKRLSAEERAEAEANNYRRVFVELEYERIDPETRRHGRWEVCFPACAGFETADRQAYARHMADVHKRPLSWPQRDGNGPFARTIRAGWRPPTLAAEGKPLSKDAAAQTQVCPTCDLVAEVSGNAGELWWAEHTRGCAIAGAS